MRVRLRAIEVENYRGITSASIADVTLMNLFVGPNGVGKSSLANAVARFLPLLYGWPRALLDADFRFTERSQAVPIKLNWELAKEQADEFAANYVAPKAEPEAEPEPLTLGRLFEMYLKEVTPVKGERARKHDKVAAAMFAREFGAGSDPAHLSKRDWDKFIAARSAGATGPSRAPVGPRTVERDLRFLLAVLNWGTRVRDGAGTVLLERNPLRGLTLPREKNPRRVILSNDEYGSLLRISGQLDWRFHVALVLAHETGHRIGAIRELRWSDIDLQDGDIRWRGEHEKNGYEHTTPLTNEARVVLELARTRNAGIGDAPALPSPKDSGRPVSRHLMRDWWKKAEVLAKLEPRNGRGWHSLRRKFASDLMHKPLKVVCELGGWKTPRGRCSNAISTLMRSSYERPLKTGGALEPRESTAGIASQIC